MEPTNTGTITTQNLVPTADSGTAGSTVALRSVERATTLVIQVTGTYTGALTVQGRLKEGGTWVSLGSTVVLNVGTGVYTATITSALQGMFQVNISAFTGVRVTALAAVTGAATVTLKATVASALFALSNPIPTGTNSIGTVVLGAPATATTTSITKAEDAVAANGDSGIFNLMVRRDAPTISTSATGDYSEMAGGRHGQLYIQTIDAAKRTYVTGGKITPAVGTILEIFGAASTTVEINRVTLTLFGTSASKLDVVINKRSTASTGGTSTTPAKVPYDAADAAAAAGVKLFTAAPTNGTLVGMVRQAMISNEAGQASERLKIESGQYAKSFTLTAAAQALTVELAGTLPTAPELAIDIEWTEY